MSDQGAIESLVPDHEGATRTANDGQPPEPMRGTAVLSCRELSKNYGTAHALGPVTFDVQRGRIVGLLGPNGSGKTTLIKLIAGLLTPTSGSVSVCGNPIGTISKSIVSYLPERPYFSRTMRVDDCLSFFAEFYADFDRPLAYDMLGRLGVSSRSSFVQLSKGTKEKIQLVLVMARHASLYLLDEPIAGVDPAARDFILDTIISHYRRDASILLSTHLVADVEHVLDDYLFLFNGSIQTYAPVEYARETLGTSLDDLFRRTFRC